MEITNKTKRPLRIPLPDGKKLHLGPGKTGQITAKAAEHPPLKKLLDAGDIEIAEGGRGASKDRSSGVPGVKGAQHDPGSGSYRQSGDR